MTSDLTFGSSVSPWVFVALASEYQDREEKGPVNGRGEDARLDRLSNPESEQTKLDDFE